MIIKAEILNCMQEIEKRFTHFKNYLYTHVKKCKKEHYLYRSISVEIRKNFS